MGHKIKHKAKKQKEEIQQVEQQAPVVEEPVVYNDQFVEAANKALNETVKYRNLVFGTVIGIFVVVLIYSFYSNHKQSKIAELSMTFSTAQSLFDRPVAAVETDDVINTAFKNSEEKYKTALSSFQDYASKNSDKPLGVVSHLYIGNAYFELGKYDDALKSYQTFIEKTNDVALRELTTLRIGLIYKMKKEFDKSIDFFDKVLTSTNEYVCSAALYNKGEVYDLQNQKDKAKEAYEKITKTYKNSYFDFKAQQKLNN